jgi:hypothetical protein
VRVTEILFSYLLEHKKLQLTALGVFRLTGSYIMSEDDKKVILPEGALEFDLGYQTPEDPDLIRAIAERTGKMKALASADLESFIEQGKQLLNISKPFILEGIGTLQKNHRNEVEFIPLGDESMRSETHQRKEEPGEPVRFQQNVMQPSRSEGSNSRALVMGILFMVALGILGWVVYYFYTNSKKQEQEFSASDSPAATASSIVLPIDSTTVRPQSRPDTVAVPQPGPTTGFFVVLEKANRDRAIKRFADLKEWGHNVVMVTKDSVTFKISLPIKAPLADTAYHRDSLERFFGRKVWIEQ